MDPKLEEELVKIQTEKQKEGRIARSTACFYDETYWGRHWSERFKAEADENNEAIKFETDKKVVFIKKFFPDTTSVLDVACSFGFLSARFQDDGIVKSYGIDISQPAIDKAPLRIRPKILNMSILDIKFGENEFDLVTAFDVFEHLYIEEIMKAVKEVNRVAKNHILIRLPHPSFDAEPWLADLSYKGLTREHVSMYPWSFWARRFHELGKFNWWFTQIWSAPPEDEGRGETCEAWITFKRK